MRRIACLVVCVLAGTTGAAKATSIVQTVSLDAGETSASFKLPWIGAHPAFNVNVSGTKVRKLAVDLRSRARSVGSPDVRSCFADVCSFTYYRPLAAGVYTVVLSKKTGPAVTVTVKVGW